MEQEISENYRKIDTYLKSSESKSINFPLLMKRLNFYRNDEEKFNSTYEILKQRISEFLPDENRKKVVLSALEYIKDIRAGEQKTRGMEDITMKWLRPSFGIVLNGVWNLTRNNHINMRNEKVKINIPNKKIYLNIHYDKTHTTQIELRKKKNELEFMVDTFLGHRNNDYRKFLPSERLAEPFHNEFIKQNLENCKIIREQMKIILSLPNTIKKYLEMKLSDWEGLVGFNGEREIKKFL